jgi:hypothetical protein
MTPSTGEIRRRELGGPDPLDRRIGPAHPPSTSWLLPLLRTRSALGLSPSLTPAIVFLPLGALLGPQVLGLLSSRALSRLDPVVDIALAVLGILVGLAFGRDIRRAPRLFAAASIESAITIGAVAAATIYFSARTGTPLGVAGLFIPIALGLCASASSATSADPDSEPDAAVATRVADLDDVLPILVVIALPALFAGGSRGEAWQLALAPIAVGLVVGGLGWLLFERADSGGERVVFVLGALGLVAGASAALDVSALASGFVAGACWTLVPGNADRVIQRDLSKVQHPLVCSCSSSPARSRTWAPRRCGCWHRTCCSGWRGRSAVPGRPPRWWTPRLAISRRF